jgi:hypothetical protein
VPAPLSLPETTRKYAYKKRQPAEHKPPLSAKREKLLNPEHIAKTLATECCSQFCIGSVCPNNLRALRDDYLDLQSEDACSQRLITVLKTFVVPGNSSSSHTHYRLFGMSVCRTAFQIGYGISKEKLDNCLHAAHLGASSLVHGNVFAQRGSPSFDGVFAWQKHFFEGVCDPVSTDRGTVLLLPQCYQFSVLWRLYCADFESHRDFLDQQPASQSTFDVVRKDSFPHVIQPRKSTLPRCSVCDELNAKLLLAKHEHIKAVRLLVEQHTEYHRGERANLAAAIEAARHDNTTLLLSVDYTDPIRLPHVRLPGPPKVGV